MATKTLKTVQLIPTWKAAASIYITAIVNGTPEGQRAGIETERPVVCRISSWIDTA